MRRLRHLLVLSACLALSGCSSSSTVDALQSVRPSSETTSSISRAVVPKAAVGADAGYAGPAQATVTALAEPDQVSTPATMQVALVAPSKSAMAAGDTSRRTVYGQRFKDAKPINFGKVTPQHHPIHGVDVSRWQGEIDWATLRAQGANFAFIKATDGGDHLDPMFRKNWAAAEAAGIRRGAYHFMYWCRTGSSQADWFIRNVPKVAGALPPVLDVEYNHLSACKKRLKPSDVRDKMKAFMDKLEAHYGQRPIIYTAPDFYADNLKGHFLDYPFWLRSVAAHPSKRYPGRNWVFWQYSGSGLSKGVTGEIDLNVFAGSEADWHKWIARNVRGGAVASN
jgi:lysozyme